MILSIPLKHWDAFMEDLYLLTLNVAPFQLGSLLQRQTPHLLWVLRFGRLNSSCPSRSNMLYWLPFPKKTKEIQSKNRCIERNRWKQEREACASGANSLHNDICFPKPRSSDLFFSDCTSHYRGHLWDDANSLSHGYYK